jgi:hypothetical protein
MAHSEREVCTPGGLIPSDIAVSGEEIAFLGNPDHRVYRMARACGLDAALVLKRMNLGHVDGVKKFLRNTTRSDLLPPRKAVGTNG